MDPTRTALILIGYQNDYFASDGVLHEVFEEPSRITRVLANTIDLVERLSPTRVLIVSTPIIFTPDYSELIAPVGILKVIKEKEAFKAGTEGSETVPELRRFGERIIEVPGKRGLNAFSNTDLDDVLRKHGITDVVIGGIVTSICVDSTGRYASELGYNVSILSNCTFGRTAVEQEFYCRDIFPIYGEVIDHMQLLRSLGVDR